MQTESHLRPAFTLIEVLVVIGVLSILLALLLPAVQSAHDAARLSQCQNNLRQIGVALHSYHESQNCFPTGVTTYSYGDGTFYGGFYSVHDRLLAYLDQSPLYNAINFATGTWPPDTFLSPPAASKLRLNSANSTVYQTGIGMFLCPSDGGPFAETGNNYRGNTGVGPSGSTWAETPDSGNGVFPEIGTTSAAKIPDGLSHTVAFSERLRRNPATSRPIQSVTCSTHGYCLHRRSDPAGLSGRGSPLRYTRIRDQRKMVVLDW